MDFFQVLSSVNKVSLVFFIITLIFLCVEFYFYFKNRKSKVKPTIPGFNPDKQSTLNPITLPVAKIQQPAAFNPGKKGFRLFPIVLTLVILVVSGAGMFFFAPKQISQVTQNFITQEPELLNEGIHLYSSDWKELETSELPGYRNKTMFIGLENSGGSNINKARIRVNKLNWNAGNETQLFNRDKNVYYIQYVIASDTARLQIQGQLHHVRDGWPE